MIPSLRQSPWKHPIHLRLQILHLSFMVWKIPATLSVLDSEAAQHRSFNYLMGMCLIMQIASNYTLACSWVLYRAVTECCLAFCFRKRRHHVQLSPLSSGVIFTPPVPPATPTPSHLSPTLASACSAPAFLPHECIVGVQ